MADTLAVVPASTAPRPAQSAAQDARQRYFSPRYFSPGTAVTVSSIAATAGVSRSWLYTQDDLRAAIAELMKRRPGRRPPPAAASDESLRRRLEASQASGKKLREDNTDLRRRLEAAHGEIRRLRALAPHPGD